MYREIQDLVHEVGALLFLPPYSPDMNPIEVQFSLLKRWVQKHANMAFRDNPLAVLRVAMDLCTKGHDDVGVNLYRHCGYSKEALTFK
ncbi:Transposase [Phytophthora megakarya]|uniref:Transposase n=1 Tax=Phytophthora megakarya TaxID=4795 RepID=A0A225W4A4_9STRA|nr:Transposase [Phytophthora megakarya]